VFICAGIQNTTGHGPEIPALDGFEQGFGPVDLQRCIPTSMVWGFLNDSSTI